MLPPSPSCHQAAPLHPVIRPCTKDNFLDCFYTVKNQCIPRIWQPSEIWSPSQIRNPTTKQSPQGPSHKHVETGKPKTIRLQYQRHLINYVWQYNSFVNPSKESLDTLQQKHPQAPPNLMLFLTPSATTPPIYFSQTQINAAIFSFPHRSGAGPEGLQPQHLKDCIPISRADASTFLLASLIELVNHLMNGHLPTPFQPFLYGAQLHRLHKSNRYPRPIVVGCTYQRLAAKTLYHKAPQAMCPPIFNNAAWKNKQVRWITILLIRSYQI